MFLVQFAGYAMRVLIVEEASSVAIEPFMASSAGSTVSNAPTDIFLDANLVSENTFAGEKVGWLTVAGADENDTFTFSLTDDAGGRFSIDDFGDLVVANAALIDFETAQSHTVTVRVADGAGQTFDKSFVITVIDETIDGLATGSFLIGSAGPDSLSGTAGEDKLDGFFGDDILQGFAADDILRGSLGNDTLYGGDGSDWLSGEDGQDVLFGGKGRDRFVFETKPNRKEIDKIVDFSVKDDTIFLGGGAMPKLGSRVGSHTIKLKKDFFVIGNRAKDANDYIVYDNKKGILYYDSNGSSAGGAVAIATLSKKLKMTAADFLIF